VKKRLARQEGELASTFLYRYALLTGVVPERGTGGHCGPRDLWRRYKLATCRQLDRRQTERETATEAKRLNKCSPRAPMSRLMSMYERWYGQRVHSTELDVYATPTLTYWRSRVTPSTVDHLSSVAHERTGSLRYFHFIITRYVILGDRPTRSLPALHITLQQYSYCRICRLPMCMVRRWCLPLWPPALYMGNPSWVSVRLRIRILISSLSSLTTLVH